MRTFSKFAFVLTSLLLVTLPFSLTLGGTTKVTAMPCLVDTSPRPATGSSGLNTYAVVPITIFRVEGATISPKDVEDLLARLNKIYNCEAVVFVWNGQILDLPDPNPPPADGGTGPGAKGDIEFPEAGHQGEHNDLKKACDEHPLKPANSGVHLVICNDIVNSTGNSQAGGYVLGDQNPAVVRDYSAQNKDWGGNAWAHEIGHVFGLDHNGNQWGNNVNRNQLFPQYDVVSDANGDGSLSASDKNNVMYGGFPPGPGDQLTPKQHLLAYYAAMNYTGAYNRTLPANGSNPIPPNKPVQITPINHTKPIEVHGPTPAPNQHNISVWSAALWRNLNKTDPRCNLTLKMNGTVQFYDPAFSYGFVITTPGGAPSYNITFSGGIGKVYTRPNDFVPWGEVGMPDLHWEVTFNDTWTTGEMLDIVYAPGALDKLINGTGTYLEASTMHVTLWGEDVNDLFANDLDTGVYEHNFTAFATHDVAPGEFYGKNCSTETVNLGAEKIPYILTNRDFVARNETVTVSFYDFSPSTTVEVYLEGARVIQNTTDGNGYCTGEFLVPQIEDDIYILFANDSSGLRNAMYLQVSGDKPTETEPGDDEPPDDGTGEPNIPGFPVLMTILAAVVTVVYRVKRARPE